MPLDRGTQLHNCAAQAAGPTQQRRDCVCGCRHRRAARDTLGCPTKKGAGPAQHAAQHMEPQQQQRRLAAPMGLRGPSVPPPSCALCPAIQYAGSSTRQPVGITEEAHLVIGEVPVRVHAPPPALVLPLAPLRHHLHLGAVGHLRGGSPAGSNKSTHVGALKWRRTVGHVGCKEAG